MPNKHVSIRHAHDADYRQIEALRSEAGFAPEAAESFRRSLHQPGFRNMVLELDGEPIGFCQALLLPPEVELLEIAVSLAHQGRGWGRKLLDDLLDESRKVGCRRCRLEVRASNHAARRLYESAGFRYTGRRKGYYDNPTEDALLMEFVLDALSETQ